MASNEFYDLCQQIPPVKDFFSGHSSTLSNLPHNIIVFQRHRPFQAKHGSHHHRFVLVTCLRAPAATVIDGRSYYLEPGTGILIFPYQAHNFAQFKRKDVWWWFVTFEIENSSCLESLRNHPFQFTDQDQKIAQELVIGYLESCRRKPAGKDILSFRLGELLARLVRRKSQFRKPKENKNPLPEFELVRVATSFIHEQIEKKILLADVAEHVALSESRLRTIFREVVGVSLGKYILTARLTRACKLLHQSEMTIAETATACGFDSLYSFSRAFKKRLGISPSAYRAGKETKFNI